MADVRTVRDMMEEAWDIVAPVTGEIVSALVRNRFRLSQPPDWAARLRLAADLLDPRT